MIYRPTSRVRLLWEWRSQTCFVRVKRHCHTHLGRGTPTAQESPEHAITKIYEIETTNIFVGNGAYDLSISYVPMYFFRSKRPFLCLTQYVTCKHNRKFAILWHNWNGKGGVKR